ncbi:hypothetical protein BDQ17DRAFT_476394 [Cyathus striatus]|nr:hypothetical protein BDQ17DRAFT_476394 [Cyathus striatus]
MSDTLQLYQTLPHPASRSKDRSGYGKPKLAWIRSEKPVKHYLIDFGISRYYPEESPRLRRAGFSGVARCVPEFRENSNLLCDPFAVDVFCAGHLIRTILQVGDKLCGTAYRSLEFLDDLIVDMVQDNPGKRPTMDEVVRRFADIVRGLDNRKLGSRAVPVNERLSLWMRFLKIVGLPNTNRDQYVTTI